MNEREAYIALNMMESVGPVRVRAMATALGSLQAIFTAGVSELMAAEGIGPEVARSLASQRSAVDPGRELKKAESLGFRVLTPADAEYPEPLRAIHGPPLALYVRGALDPHDRHAVAVVGTRHATHYGLTVADRLGYQLAKVGFAVVSGLARGIDTAAHKGALKGGGRTLAVLGSGLDCVYPPENQGLADEIAEHGAVLSEFPLGTEPDRVTFPVRNRIVSGLSMGVVVVEAGLGSGALHTADDALEQGRAVFAVPGRIDTAASKGTHRLIKNGARLVDDVDDILQEFEFLIPPEKRKAAVLDARPAVQLSGDEQAVVRALWEGALDVDALTRKVSMKTASVSSLLIGLEMKRVVRMLPGRMVELAEGIRNG
ncbi:MAG: DNA-processing protein DprA [Verrucomicrobiota bacterium]